ncbi:MAG TPA: alpha/beta hydrolase [Candidatus Dormibacteraeota bacterium]|nr:alpha/beta hydrolase [Candidatus Dormibacteraeota bacterium]
MTAFDFEVGHGDHRIAGWRAGQGPAVVVLHGGPGLSEYTASLLPELEDGYSVVRFQQRGIAPSTTAGPFAVENQVDDTISVIDGLGLGRPLVIGHSWGGHLAMHLLASRPGRLAGALVIDPLGAVGDGGEADLGRILGERATPEAAARSEALDQRALRGEGTAADQIEGLRLVWPGYFADPATAPAMPDLEISIAAYSETFTSIRQHFERGTLESALPRTSLPVLFLLGAQSPIPNSYGLASAALIPEAEVTILPGCGHFPWLERPGAVRAALDRLSSRVVAGA